MDATFFPDGGPKRIRCPEPALKRRRSTIRKRPILLIGLVGVGSALVAAGFRGQAATQTPLAPGGAAPISAEWWSGGEGVDVTAPSGSTTVLEFELFFAGSTVVWTQVQDVGPGGGTARAVVMAPEGSRVSVDQEFHPTLLSAMATTYSSEGRYLWRGALPPLLVGVSYQGDVVAGAPWLALESTQGDPDGVETSPWAGEVAEQATVQGASLLEMDDGFLDIYQDRDDPAASTPFVSGE